MTANEQQVGGTHYKGKKFEHWDIVHEHQLDYFQGQITKYVMRWKMKNGVQDLEKARHFLDKYIELNKEYSLLDQPEEIEDPIDPNNMPHCPKCWTWGHEHRKTCIFAGQGMTHHVYPVAPTGWIGFTYEGGQVNKDFFTCKKCGTYFETVKSTDPNEVHCCAGPRYINQDGGDGAGQTGS